MEKKDFENVPCDDCSVPMFGGWVEVPIFRGDEEGIIEMYIGYCPSCSIVQNKIQLEHIYGR